jgi:cytochrome P450
MASTVALSDLHARLAEFFLGEPAAVQDPYPLFHELRAIQATHLLNDETAVLTSHRAVRDVYRAHDLYPPTPARGNPSPDLLRLLSADDLAALETVRAFDAHFLSRKQGVDHARVRSAAHRYFTPGRIELMRSNFQAIWDDLLREFGPTDEVDIVKLAYRLPLLAITDLLGVPREDVDRVKQWGDAIVASPGTAPLTPLAVQAALTALDEHRQYVRELIERHRRDPGKSDLIAGVLDAADGNRLTGEELVAFFILTLFAGHETTQYMIANGVFALMAHHEQWNDLCREIDLVPSAVEEILRWDTPVQYVYKVAAHDSEIAGTLVPAGATLVLMHGAANRDPAVFEDPDAFVIKRNPNEHLAFGFGVHFCLGASLARMEGQIVFSTLARRYPALSLAIAPEDVRFRGGLRAPLKLPVYLGEACRYHGSHDAR